MQVTSKLKFIEKQLNRKQYAPKLRFTIFQNISHDYQTT